MKLDELVEDYIASGGEGHGKNGNCSYRDGVFFSYQTAVCRRLCEDIYLVGVLKYSQSTSKHVSALMKQLPGGPIQLPAEIGHLDYDGVHARLQSWTDTLEQEMRAAGQRSRGFLRLKRADDLHQIASDNMDTLEMFEHEIRKGEKK